MATLNFADIQKAADEKFSDFVVVVPAEDGKGTEDLVFLHLLRQPKDVRATYAKALDIESYKKDPRVKDADMVDGLLILVKEAFRVIARSPREFERLEAVIRAANGGMDDIAVWQELFAEYHKETEAGEV